MVTTAPCIRHSPNRWQCGRIGTMWLLVSSSYSSQRRSPGGSARGASSNGARIVREQAEPELPGSADDPWQPGLAHDPAALLVTPR